MTAPRSDDDGCLWMAIQALVFLALVVAVVVWSNHSERACERRGGQWISTYPVPSCLEARP